MPEEDKVLVRRAFEEVFNEGNLDVADGIFADDYVAHDPASPDVAGPESFKRLVSSYRSAFPDLHDTIEEQIAEGDRVATRFTMRATHRGEFLGIVPTGREVVLMGMVIYRVSEGKKIAERWAEVDALGLVRRLGAGPSSSG